MPHYGPANNARKRILCGVRISLFIHTVTQSKSSRTHSKLGESIVMNSNVQHVY